MICFIVLCYIATPVFAGDENFSSYYFIAAENRHLAAQVAKKLYSASLLSRSLACLRNSWCFFTNFKRRTDGRGICELMRHESNSSDDNNKLVHQKGTTFTTILKGCLMTGCLNGGSCLLDKEKETFVCSCKLPWSGQRCQVNSNCPAGWSKYDDSCYYLNGTVAKNQRDARTECQTRGGDLPIIRSATENKFVFKMLKNSDNVTFSGAWLGLERDNDTKVFHWIDNTPLEGKYNNWDDREPNNQYNREDCVNMWVKQAFNITKPGTWNDFSCSCTYIITDCPVILCQKPLKK